MSVILHITAVICALFIVSLLMRMARAFGVLSPGLGQGALSSVLGWTKRHPVLTTVILLSVLSWIFFPKGCSDEPSGNKSSNKTTEMSIGKEAHVVSPTAEDEPKGTIVGGPKEVVSNVSPDRINEWMLKSMAGPETGWNLMRRRWSGEVDKHGYLPLPIGPLLPGVKVEIQLSGRTLPCSPAWKVIRQDHERVQSARGESSIGSDVVALFLEVRDLIGIPQQPIFGERIGFSGLECSATVSKLPSNAGLWVGSYSTCTANSHQAPGLVPFSVDGEGVDWTMRITFIPSEPVAPGAWELKETITVPGFYDTQQPRLWLLHENDILDNSSPEALKESMDTMCVFRKELRPLFPAKESPTRDSFTITSTEVRRFWERNPEKQVELAEVHFQPPTQALVYWEMFFPVADAESE
ncbi:MAG: hypothetical protein A3I08_00490 [Candidatus Andersenbacteria bacterium RIFCSPLOWO2_02_FULL_46_11]|nr:MAG: hypothetical protein UW94_C0016G0002 [Parcubacteria group bacterium GW2011_GWA2_45_14]OGY38483.1 MAG: hypothetical protein A3I08_00490 [Candidatus Andersenbacteria bacterium RIFCSPLOWO2_02_FULL_46_11]